MAIDRRDDSEGRSCGRRRGDGALMAYVVVVVVVVYVCCCCVLCVCMGVGWELF